MPEEPVAIPSKITMWERCRTPAGLLAMFLAALKYGFEYWDKASTFFEHAPFISKVLSSKATTPILLIIGVALILWELSTLRMHGEPVRRHLRTHLVDSVKAAAILLLVFCLIFVLSFVLQPRTGSQNSSKQQQEPTKPTTQIVPEEKKTDKNQNPKKPKAKPREVGKAIASGENSGAAGNINQGPCSNVQVGGSNNTATTNCEPPPAVTVTGKAQMKSTEDIYIGGLRVEGQGKVDSNNSTMIAPGATPPVTAKEIDEFLFQADRIKESEFPNWDKQVTRYLRLHGVVTNSFVMMNSLVDKKRWLTEFRKSLH